MAEDEDVQTPVTSEEEEKHEHAKEAEVEHEPSPDSEAVEHISQTTEHADDTPVLPAESQHPGTTGLGIENADAESDIPPPQQHSSSANTDALDDASGKTMHGLSGDFPYPVSPPPSSADRRQALEQRSIGERTTSPPPSNATRKASTGFGALLGRMGNMRKGNRSPPAPKLEPRNSTASMRSADHHHATPSISSTTSRQGARPSLQDQFSSLRRQEEYSTAMNGDYDASPSTIGPSDPADASQPDSPDSHVRQSRATSSASASKTPVLNTSLPPGTATGMTVGPSLEDEEVDWDLWQQVVYEGPAAVARSSGDELNHAIAMGIPPAIRGVVWQVLAESKNEELEEIYRTLKAKGTEADRPPPAARSISTMSAITLSDKEAATSDASSEHSETSTTTRSALASPSATADTNGIDAHVKAVAEKQKREAVALQKLEKAIKRDLGSRTSYSKYTQSAGLQDGLFGVCKAYALFDEAVGYAQGINFIAMPLLFNMTEEEAFTLLVRLMSKYDLRSMFTSEMVGLHLRLYQFERLLEDLEPAVYCHLKRRHVAPQLYATQWFLTLFAYRFPLQLVLRIYDLILCEGLTAILKFGVALMQRNRAALLEMKDMSQLTNFLKERIFDIYIDKSPTPSSLLDSGFFGSVTGGADKELYRAEEMIRDACAITIPDATLALYTTEWEETRAREAETDALRVGHAALTAQVRALEERGQQHDAEHVTFAHDLVRVKMENDALADENEGLRLQVAELQKLLDAQPAEVEAKLKTEMDRIMQRNIEVQNENRALKEEVDEMEHELVNAKMLHAQTQSDHDSLKQKWSSVQALMSDGK